MYKYVTSCWRECASYKCTGCFITRSNSQISPRTFKKNTRTNISSLDSLSVDYVSKHLGTFIQRYKDKRGSKLCFMRTPRRSDVDVQNRLTSPGESTQKTTLNIAQNIHSAGSRYTTSISWLLAGNLITTPEPQPSTPPSQHPHLSRPQSHSSQTAQQHSGPPRPSSSKILYPLPIP